MNESRSARWSRRAKTIPVMLAATAGAVLFAPVILPVSVAVDLLSGRRRFPLVRVYLFLLQYMVNDSVEILLAPLMWAQAGFGTRLQSPVSIDRHQRLQAWSIRLLEQRAEQLLGLRYTLTDADQAALEPGPVIVISRHASLFDASLPGLIYQKIGYKIQGIVMAELLADPGFDILYGRLGSVFIPRDDGETARATVRAMTAGADERTMYGIFPEGRLFHPTVRDKALARLAHSNPTRSERLQSLTGVLPPRPGGLLTLLAELPTADVVVVRHRGLDGLSGLGRLVKVVPKQEPLTVSVQRIPRHQIPDDPDEQIRWLDELWLTIDQDLTRTRK